MMNQNLSEDNSHHVAWADRIGLNKQWARDIEACSDAFGTPFYIVMVKRFMNNIPNMRGDGPKLYDMLKEYESILFKEEMPKMMNQYLVNYPDDAGSESTLLMKEDEFRRVLSQDLYRAIIQLLEDNGFGFYASTIEEDELR